jgi:hypothetical protein
MTIRVKYNHWFPKLIGYSITLYPFILLSDTKENITKTYLLEHEFIHVAQIRKEGVLKFYTNYLFQFVKNFIKSKDRIEAYMNIPYEIEAYSYQDKRKITEEYKEN